VVGWHEALGEKWPERSSLIMLGDPFSFPADSVLARLGDDRPTVTVMGGMASAAAAPGENRLILGRSVFDRGAVAVLLAGAVQIRPVVSQGCRPIGSPYVVTKAERNIIYELGGKPALLQLKQVFDSLPAREQRMVQQGLHLGRVISEYQDHFDQGDFLIRNVMGIQPDDGSIVIADWVRPGQTVKFHIRDAETADAEMRQLLTQASASGAACAGGLLFSCNGRGTRLFEHPHHDALAVHDALGPIPLAGFFAAGELGPVGGRNFVHGFTASLAIFLA
jgi:small ligand-binding sensory domain FIST